MIFYTSTNSYSSQYIGGPPKPGGPRGGPPRFIGGGGPRIAGGGPKPGRGGPGGPEITPIYEPYRGVRV